MGQFILNMKIHRSERGLCRSPSSWLASDVTFRTGKSQRYQYIGIWYLLGFRARVEYFFHVSFLTSMSLLYGRVLGTRLLGNRRFNVGLIFIKKNIKVGQKWRL